MLNVTQDHLDRHARHRRLRAPPRRASSRGDGVQVLNRDDPRVAARMARAGPAASSRFGARRAARPSDFGVERDGKRWCAGAATAHRCAVDALRIRGAAQRRQRAGGAARCVATLGAAARAAARRRCASSAACRTALEPVARRDGVEYFDDSQGHQRRRDRRRAARPRRRRVVLIPGGDGKGQDFAPLRAPVTRSSPRRAADRPRRAADRAALAARRAARALRVARGGGRSAPRDRAQPATPCCCRRPARASTCSATTRTAARCSPPRCRALAA